MPDDATALSAMRAGKIDILYGMSNTQAQGMKSSNPEINQITVEGTNTYSIEPRCDKGVFSNLKVREALQMAINIPDIASSYYGGNCSSYPSATTSMYLTGWGLGNVPRLGLKTCRLNIPIMWREPRLYWRLPVTQRFIPM